MNFVNFHWGDWARSTQDLTPLERGVYIDLLQRYYQKERPLMHEECKRIARAYAPDAQEAMHYVLGEFFIQEGDSYRHERCEIEIAKYRETVEKRVKASKARWSKEKAKKTERNHAAAIDACSTKCNASGYAHADQVQSESNANGMLPNTQYPIPNKEITPVGPLADNPPPEADEPPQTLFEPEEIPEEPDAPAKKERKPLVPFPETLPDEWREAAKIARPDVDPQVVFNKLRSRYAPTTSLKTIGNWRKIFLDWIGREYARTTLENSGSARSSAPTRRFAADSYLGPNGERPNYALGIDENFRPIRMPR